jgi:hypothetical protein
VHITTSGERSFSYRSAFRKKIFLYSGPSGTFYRMQKVHLEKLGHLLSEIRAPKIVITPVRL